MGPTPTLPLVRAVPFIFEGRRGDVAELLEEPRDARLERRVFILTFPSPSHGCVAALRFVPEANWHFN